MQRPFFVWSWSSRVGFAHMKLNSLLSSCQLAFFVVVMLSIVLSNAAMVRWESCTLRPSQWGWGWGWRWGICHCRCVVVVVGGTDLCVKVACCEWCQHLGLGISLGWMVLSFEYVICSETLCPEFVQLKKRILFKRFGLSGCWACHQAIHGRLSLAAAWLANKLI